MRQTVFIVFASVLVGRTLCGVEAPKPFNVLKAGPIQGDLYSPIGKKDPFRPPTVESFDREPSALTALEKYSIQQLQLKAILKGLGRPKAMFQDPDGKTHILEEGQMIGRERASLSRILNAEVIVTERTTNYLGEENLYERVISLPKND